MAKHFTPYGSIVSFPDGIDFEEFAIPSPGSRGLRGGAQSPDLIGLLKQSGLDPGEAFELKMPDGALPFAADPVEIEVGVGPDQQTVVLVERDGVYTWRYPERDADAHALRAAGRVRLRLDPVPPAPSKSKSTRNWVHDVVADWLGSAVRVYVLRFAARVLAAPLASFLERHVATGIVHVKSFELTEWRHSSDERPALPVVSPKRILLLVHGTFSSTAGSFGVLCAKPAGRAFLAAAFAHYDCVIGFDHRTLTQSPEENASELLAALKNLDFAQDAELDAIAFSRGGLVLRVLTEQLLLTQAADKPLPTPKRLVFVGCTNGGTGLAQPGNWKRLLDLYTNMVLAATHVAGWVPGAGAGAALVSETVKSLSSFVQALADAAIAEDRVPGLAAMEPNSETVLALNDAPLPVAQLHRTRYFWAGTGFDARLTASASFVEGLRNWLLNEFSDQLMVEPNDLVVDLRLMAQFGQHAELVRGERKLSPREGIYHTIYFMSAELLDCLGEWLLGRPNLISRIESDALVLDGLQTNEREALALPDNDPLAPVVVKLTESGHTSFHLMRTEALRAKLSAQREPPWTVAKALSLSHDAATRVETDASHVRDVVKGFVANTLKGADDRSVVMVNGRLVGVVLDGRWQAGRRADGAPGNTTRGAAGARPAAGESLDTPPEDTSTGMEPGAPGSAPASAHTVSPAAQPATFDCQVEAKMDARPSLAMPSPVRVMLSRESADIEATLVHRVASAQMEENQPIMVTVRAVRNCTIVGPAECRVPPPAPAQPQWAGFWVQGIAEGDAELLITVLQGGRRLLTIALNPSFVDTTASTTVRAAVRLDASEGALIDLRIRDTSIGDDSALRLDYDLSSDDLEISVQEESPPLNNNRRLTFIQGIYNGIEVFWKELENARIQAPARLPELLKRFDHNLRASGGSLCDKLVPERVRRALWQAFRAGRVGSIRVSTREPSIPWEMLYLRDPDHVVPSEQGCFLAELGLVRWDGALGYPPSHVEINPSRALALIPEYPERMRLDCALDDYMLLKNLFGVRRIDATYEHLSKLFDNEPFDLFHAACHGEAVPGRPWDAGLLLPQLDGNGRFECLRAYLLEGGVQHPNRPLVFLNACQVGRPDEGLAGAAGLAQAFLVNRKASVVVAPMWSVHDKTASLFARHFYERLIGGATLSSAVRFARDTVKASGDPTWLAYSVWGHPYARVGIAGGAAGGQGATRLEAANAS